VALNLLQFAASQSLTYNFRFLLFAMDKTPEPYIACIKCGDEVPQSTVSKRNWCAECEDENSLLEIERDME
jgi:hypothetical protein